MGAVLALSWNEPSSAAVGRSIAVAAARNGFTPLSVTEAGWLGVGGPRAPALHDLKGGLTVLGDLFETPHAGFIGLGWRLDRLKAVTRCRWGRYLALDRDKDGSLRAVLRDPSGAMEVVTWMSSGVRIVSTGTPDWLMAAAPAPVAIDWDGVPALLMSPLAGLAQPPLRGLTVLNAGEVIDFDTGLREQVWRPVTADRVEIWDVRIAREGLRDRVETVVGCLAAQIGRPGAELSGGLDSAIIAVALGQGRKRVKLWLNAYSARAETDERRYARAVAAHLGLSFSPQQRIEQALESGVLDQTAGDVRPGYNGADPVFDALVADACETHGVDGLFTGKGGDALFYQGASAAVFGDLLQARGPWALMSPMLAGVARWTRRSMASVVKEAWSDQPVTPVGERVGILTAPSEGWVQSSHPWLDGAETLPRGKRLQLHALISNLAYATACRRTSVVDLIHPLMAQPLVEWAMKLPTPILTAGVTDRHLARSAFADSLPPDVVWRRSKGDYTATFEREAAASLPFLRAHLLDGLLARHGVIDRVRTEALLDRDRLMWGGGSHHLTSAAVVESWLRRWTGRRA